MSFFLKITNIIFTLDKEIRTASTEADRKLSEFEVEVRYCIIHYNVILYYILYYTNYLSWFVHLLSANEIISVHIVPVCDNGLICFIFLFLICIFPCLCVLQYIVHLNKGKKRNWTERIHCTTWNFIIRKWSDIAFNLPSFSVWERMCLTILWLSR